MAIKSKDELLATIRDRLGEDTSDDALSLIEDISDTMSDFESKTKGDGKDWEAEAKRIDEQWRQKYRDRFFSGSSDDDEDIFPEPEPVRKQYRFEDLFKED